MFKFWQKILSEKSIRSRILTRGFALTVIPLILVLLVTWIANGVANSVSVEGSARLASQDLNHAVVGLVSACKLYDINLSSAVRGAGTVVERAGAIHFDSSESVLWQAKNQLTAETTPLRLPLMRVGETALRPVAEFSKEAPIVDEVQALYQLSATVFQRMNESGDMLRVATTVKKADGLRAIGTFIPASANGKPNPVISKVLKGETYLGRAFVVDSWYMAAYQPLKDSKGSVIGMIYTGMPEGAVRDKISQFRNASESEDDANVFIVHTAGKEQGLFVFSNDPSLQGQNGWNNRDAQGALYVQDICKRASANPGTVSEATYWSLAAPGKPSEKMTVRFSYFPAWDWVIGVQEPERVFLATPTRIRNIFFVSNYLPLFLAILSAVVALAIWKKLANQILDQVLGVMKSLDQSAKQVTQVVRAISGSADSVGDAANELFRTTQNQASSAEETSAMTSQMTDAAKRNSQTAEKMLELATSTEKVFVETKRVMKDVDGAMQAIITTNDEALSIVDTINEISFATNIVALNASVEAAKAGEAGRTFVFIADEVRDLAAKVAAAAQETRKIITNSRSESKTGTELVAKLGLALSPLGQNTDQVRAMASDVSSTSASQAESMKEVLVAVEEMQRATENTAQSALQSTKDATQLRAQVAALSASVRTVDQAVGKLNEEFLGVR